MTAPLLDVRDLTVRFDTWEGTVHAVTGVSYALQPGETLGIVGESGSGKSVHVLSMLGLIPKPPGRIAAGSALFEGRDLLRMSEAELQELRGGKIGMIFQDPMTSLNPVLTVGYQICESLRRHLKLSRGAALKRAVELLDLVGIPDPQKRVEQYPHQFSGGMRQRVAIAIALLNRPELIVADEPTTALDVTIQGQILAEVQKLAANTGTSLIWITHDLSVVAGLADDLAVMYAGRVVEYGDVGETLDAPLHPYTVGLLGSVPSRNKRGEPLRQIPGMTPSLLSLPPGCPFQARCPRAAEKCREYPALDEKLPNRLARCFFPHFERAEAA